ncbi:hypothetical protein ASPZODRAFT_273914 [Penicilliopsis zonata CBS 506.65]|uniref:Uncharacterized protein n=1 Tax=Penicilliopsis zonata CBS 506.65 TaxID=1073090 RepID=A0A1L9SUE7_9EURO|nr:hypothetical protein ASPZODRAFT_273914 [Penicilliopsis zonata CBS 506.65]OJJ50832.1 hypothetical protein ASPZODRAFT_273914 [Penicilliopsis zonata CBS 506.65]
MPRGSSSSESPHATKLILAPSRHATTVRLQNSALTTTWYMMNEWAMGYVLWAWAWAWGHFVFYGVRTIARPVRVKFLVLESVDGDQTARRYAWPVPEHNRAGRTPTTPGPSSLSLTLFFFSPQQNNTNYCGENRKRSDHGKM